MRIYILLFLLWSSFSEVNAQQVIINKTPYPGTDEQSLPALYYIHTKPKQGKLLAGTKDGFTKEDEPKIIAKLNEIEKLEENSRNNFEQNFDFEALCRMLK